MTLTKANSLLLHASRFSKPVHRLGKATGVLVLVALAFTTLAQEISSPDRRAFADGLMSRGLIQLALPEYRALAADAAIPERDVVLYRLAECERQAGNPDAAEKACAELLSQYAKSPMAPRARMTRGLILKAAGKNTEAASILDELATDTASPAELTATAMYHAAEARENAGNRKGAEARYTELLKRAAAPDASASVKELGAYAELRIASLRALDDTPEARADALSRYNAIAAKPFSPRIGAEALFQSAALLYRMDKFAESAARYADLAAKYPKDERVADSRLPAAWANYRAGRYADALAAATVTAETPGAGQLDAAYLRANALAQLGQRKESVAAYDALLALPAAQKSRDTMRGARYERLVVLFKDGQFQQVLDDAARFTDPPDAVLDDFIWLQAQAAEALKDEARAVQFYRMLSERRPDSRLAPDALYRLAYRLQGQQNWLEASRAYLSLAKSFPNNAHVPQALYSSGLCLAKAGKSAEAIRDWNELITRFPEDTAVTAARFQKAMVEIKSDLAREAAADLDELLAKPAKVQISQLAEAHFWRARLCYDAKELQQAEKHLRECLNCQPADEIREEASFLLGLTLQAQGREADAAACFQPLLAAPASAKFTDDRLAWLSEFQFSRKQYASARDAAKELASRKTTKEWIQAGNALTGRAHAALSETNAAIEAFRLAADSPARTKYSSEAALRLGELLVGKGDANSLAEASDYFGEAVARASSPELAAIRAKAYYALADCTARRGQKEAAARYYMAVALLFDDKDIVPKALEMAEKLYGELGFTREAAAAKAERETRYPAKGAGK